MTQMLEAPATDEVRVDLDFDELLRLTRPARPKLSDAIRRGSELTNPGRYRWVEGNPQIGYSACALGAACLSVDGDTFEHSLDGAARLFPGVLDHIRISAEHAPELAAYLEADGLADVAEANWTLGEYIITMNDSVHLSRQRIADIVEALGY